MSHLQNISDGPEPESVTERGASDPFAKEYNWLIEKVGPVESRMRVGPKEVLTKLELPKETSC